MQLSWNYNYEPAGRALGVDLLAEPERITQDPDLAFSTAMYFWMSPRGNKVSLLLLAVVLASDLALLLATSLSFSQALGPLGDDGNVGAHRPGRCGGQDSWFWHDHKHYQRRPGVRHRQRLQGGGPRAVLREVHAVPRRRGGRQPQVQRPEVLLDPVIHFFSLSLSLSVCVMKLFRPPFFFTRVVVPSSGQAGGPPQGTSRRAEGA